MQNIDIIKKSKIEKTFRVAKICDEYDIDIDDEIKENFNFNFDLPDKWKIGLIVGASGTGKTTIAKELFQDTMIFQSHFAEKSVIDDIRKDILFTDIAKMFYTVGFGSVRSWLKPYSVLSNGEKMRVELAKGLLENDVVCFDEFTSVIDRNVAQTACIAINKAIHKQEKKQAIFVSCHYDVIENLQPCWVFDTNKMQMVFQSAHVKKDNFMSKDVGETSGASLASITI